MLSIDFSATTLNAIGIPYRSAVGLFSSSSSRVLTFPHVQVHYLRGGGLNPGGGPPAGLKPGGGNCPGAFWGKPGGNPPGGKPGAGATTC